MRKNEYTSLAQFCSQYTGIWAPSEGLWLGLDFSWHGQEYRLNTGSMYNPHNTILPDGREALFGLYKKRSPSHSSTEYELLGEFSSMSDMLSSCLIGDRPFSEIIMDDDTELLGQD